MNKTKLAALHAPDPLQHHGYCGTVLRVGGPALLDEGLVGGGSVGWNGGTQAFDDSLLKWRFERSLRNRVLRVWLLAR